MKVTWVKDEKIEEGGDVGGDYQTTDSWTARFRRADDACRIITVYAFGEVPEGRWIAYEQGADAGDQAQVTAMVEYLVCTDPKDPGGTERYSDAKYLLVNETEQGKAAAEAWARNFVTELTPDTRAWAQIFDWDDLGPWERES